MNRYDGKVWTFVVMSSFWVLFLVCFDMMVIKGKYFRDLSRNNRIREVKIPALRGTIYDRKGRELAKSYYEYFVKNENGQDVYSESGGFSGEKFEGESGKSRVSRKYEQGESDAAVTGYVVKADLKDIQQDECGLKINSESIVGKMGVEEYFNCKLSGVDGKRIIETDALGKYVRELGRMEPKKGEDLTLSVDAYWQKKIYDYLGNRRGAVVMSEVETGKILALVTSPSFDPNVFTINRDNMVIKDLLSDNKDMPLLNRAINAAYQPGSVFKIVVSLAGLEEGVINENSLYEDTGVLKVGEYQYSNWLWTKKGQVDGMVDVVKGLQRSNDIFFYRLGGDVGPEKIYNWAKKMGYGGRIGVELINEGGGLVPNPDWKKDKKGEVWYLGNTYHLAIGQGDLMVSPLQVNQMMQIVANGGKKCKLSVDKDKKNECEDLSLNRYNVSLVVDGMKKACKFGGTAWPLYEFKTELACKTGTAEVGDRTNDTHAWLTVFAPTDNPEIVLTVFVERGGEGSDVAAPIAGDILRDWFFEKEEKTKIPRYSSSGKIIYKDESQL